MPRNNPAVLTLAQVAGARKEIKGFLGWHGITVSSVRLNHSKTFGDSVRVVVDGRNLRSSLIAKAKDLITGILDKHGIRNRAIVSHL